MKDLFIIWITFQLVIIGIVHANMYNEMISGKYDCSVGTEVPLWFGALNPLIAFVPENVSVIDYCKDK